MTTVRTPLCDLLRIEHPMLLAGMANVAKHELASAVSNAGGLGVIGGVTLQPKTLKEEISRLKEMLTDKTAFGVDLLIPQVGGSARKTNKDYTGGTLPELIDIICNSGARLFISAVGVPPRWAVEKLHKAGILYANMAGHPHHVDKAIELGADLIIAQGYEAGGHTGDVATMVLIPQCIDRVAGRVSAFTGKPVQVVAAGGIYDGRTAAAAFALGATGLWVGTRFVASKEATTSPRHKQHVVKAGPTDAVRTLIYTGRPCRMFKTPIVAEWEDNRQDQIRQLTKSGVVPVMQELKKVQKDPKYLKELEKQYNMKLSVVSAFPLFMGQAAGGITEILPAKVILETMMREAAQILQQRAALVPRL